MGKRKTEIIEQSGDDDYDAMVLYYEEKEVKKITEIGKNG